MTDLSGYYFRVRETGGTMYRIGDETRHRRVDLEQIAVINTRNGEIRAPGTREMAPEDRAAAEAWLEQRRAILAARQIDDIHRAIDHMNLTAQWVQSQASEADLGGRTRFWRVLALEAAILVGAAGTGVALTRTAPPAPSGSPRPLTAAEAMLGSSLPPPLDAGAWWSGWSIDSLFLPFGLAAAVWYVLAVRRLATRGVRWPWWRTALWLTGCVLFLWATNGPPGTYGRVLFSMHMIQHMTIATAVPVFLVLGAPVTLALRTLRRRDDGSRGLREFYYSSLFELSLETHTGHVLMTLHFLLSGYLFAECLVGIDPGLRRPTYPIRTLLVMVTFGFHALFSVSLMASTRVLAEEWYAALGRTWGDSLADDQYLGASLGWLLGEYPLAVIAVALLVSWVSADRRERRRFDRSEAREGDRQLHAYNAYLAGLSARTDTMQPSQSTAVLGTAEEADRS